MRPIVLASTSPFRRELMERLGIPFETAEPVFEEIVEQGEEPAELVKRLALGKAMSLAGAYPDALIIGSDQVFVSGGGIIGKPGSVERAREQLRMMSGGTHTFHTGLAVVDTASGAMHAVSIPFTVTLRDLSDEEIDEYIRRDDPIYCAGSFKIEGLGIALMERLEGDDFTSLIGLPLISLVSILRKLRVNPLAP
ncbi:MAG: nucleoside triphosphate pyrophosphatase [Geobacteraceae bacterium]|nr:nucleoside triphosphate pyrophosphatase [Geobacteraceae bacterium]